VLFFSGRFTFAQEINKKVLNPADGEVKKEAAKPKGKGEKLNSIPRTNTTQSTNSCNCWIPRDATFQIGKFDASGLSGGPGTAPEYRNDDWSTDTITLPFNICFYGTSVNKIFLNNNGNISIGAPYSTFTALSFPDPNYVMIAPFWAVVVPRVLLSGLDS